MSDTNVQDTRMQEITKYPHGAFSWIELNTPDPDKTKQFYAGLFGWTYEDRSFAEGTQYTMVYLDGKTVAGLYLLSPEMQQMGATPHWQSYITVDNVDETTAQVAAAGGTVIEQPFDVMDTGRLSLIQDPTGASVCLWQARAHIGSRFYQRPGALCWNELYTNDVPAAAAFYTTLLGWQGGLGTANGVEHGGFNHREGAPVAVIMPTTQAAFDTMPLPRALQSMPPHWAIYLGVEDVDASVAKVEALGGTVLLGTSEFAGYKFAFVQDPHGATFFIIAS